MPALDMSQYPEDVMNVPQAIYDSEINIHISTFWDGGYDVKLGDEMSGFVAEGCVRRWDDVVPWLREQAIRHYPDSAFALASRERPSVQQQEPTGSDWTPFSSPDFGRAKDRSIYEWAKAKRDEGLRLGFWLGLGAATSTFAVVITIIITVWDITIQ